jgi:DNA repair protein RadC
VCPAFVAAVARRQRDCHTLGRQLKLTKRVAAAAQILQIHFLDHIVVGQGFFSFQEAGLL